ncbi:hypothetical protein QWZ03_09330 [Chitinimonas viridis]|uniref:TonB C-terminal domain-containing protein n=1 Tax=Chitinimonas viridis TaxID=664880 RepID=A0ABT8B3Y4_9NEIS|nr:hypothetical protein [Chitinimonas viridis]MDN3576967.1 hypothetical protein [Chitinimonas viridis]
MSYIRMIASALIALATVPSYANKEPYYVEVWANVLYGTDGHPVQYSLVDEDKYPLAFADNVKARVAKTKVPPAEADGMPATLRSGVRLDFLVTPNADGGGQVKMAGLSMGPIPTKRYAASYPDDIGRTGGWEGAVEAACTVGVDGKCRLIEVKALPGMPESVRRFAKASLEGWSFIPQELAGKPIEGEYVFQVRLHTLDTYPEDFRQDRFLRLLHSR